MGKEVTVKTEISATEEDVEEADLVVSLGGDHTFLRASALIQNSSTPIMGINTARNVYTGALNSQFIDHENREEHSMEILESMEDASAVEFKKRSRILYERNRKCEM